MGGRQWRNVLATFMLLCLENIEFTFWKFVLLAKSPSKFSSAICNLSTPKATLAKQSSLGNSEGLFRHYSIYMNFLL